jgi:hypothetical protein
LNTAFIIKVLIVVTLVGIVGAIMGGER